MAAHCPGDLAGLRDRALLLLAAAGLDGEQLRGLDRIIEESFVEYGGAKVRRVGDAVYAGAMGALKLAMCMPGESWDQLAGTPM